MPTSSLHGWVTPDGSAQPQVHIDLESLSTQIDGDTPVVSSAAPAHKLGRIWTDSDNGQAWISDGTRWDPIDGRWNGNTALTSGSNQTEAAGTETAITGLTVTFEADGTSTYEFDIQVNLQTSVVGDRMSVRVKRGATLVGDSVFMNAFAGVGQTYTFRGQEVPPIGTVTYTAYFLRAGGTGTTTYLAGTSTKPSLLSVRRAA